MWLGGGARIGLYGDRGTVSCSPARVRRIVLSQGYLALMRIAQMPGPFPHGGKLFVAVSMTRANREWRRESRGLRRRAGKFDRLLGLTFHSRRPTDMRDSPAIPDRARWPRLAHRPRLRPEGMPAARPLLPGS